MRHTKRDKTGFFKGKNWQIIRFGIIFVVLTVLAFRFLAFMLSEGKTSVELSQLTIEAEFPEGLKEKISYNASQQLLLFNGFMFKGERDELLGLSQDSAYEEAIRALYKRSHTFSKFTNMSIAHGAGLILRVLRANVRVTGTLINDLDSDFGFYIVSACNGMIVCIIFAAAVIAYPCRIKEKAIGMAIGLPIIEAVNLVRIVCLYYVLLYFPSTFEASHVYVAESFIIAIGVVLWLFWVEKFVQTNRQ